MNRIDGSTIHIIVLAGYYTAREREPSEGKLSDRLVHFGYN